MQGQANFFAGEGGERVWRLLQLLWVDICSTTYKNQMEVTSIVVRYQGERGEDGSVRRVVMVGILMTQSKLGLSLIHI